MEEFTSIVGTAVLLGAILGGLWAVLHHRKKARKGGAPQRDGNTKPR